MNTWKENWEETKKHYTGWWSGKGIVLSMWEHLRKEGLPHAEVRKPAATKDLQQFWFDPQWRAENLHYHCRGVRLRQTFCRWPIRTWDRDHLP